MPSFANDYLAIRALETRLASVFATTYAANYARYNGVDVRLRTDEDSEPEHIGKPLILLEQESGERSDWSSMAGEYRAVTVAATTFVSHGSGGKQAPVANPITSDEQLSRDLVTEIETNYATWRDLGLQDIRVSSQPLNKTDGDTVRRIGHRITFKYNR